MVAETTMIIKFQIIKAKGMEMTLPSKIR